MNPSLTSALAAYREYDHGEIKDVFSCPAISDQGFVYPQKLTYHTRDMS